MNNSSPIGDTAPPSADAFVNLSNHPSTAWCDDQLAAANALAPTLVDVPFPAVSPEADAGQVARLAAQTIASLPPTTKVVMVMGEFTLTYALVNRLLSLGIRCVAASSRRDTRDLGGGAKSSHFRFVGFRDYRT